MSDINNSLKDYLFFLKEYNYKAQEVDKSIYIKNLKLISNINKITNNKYANIKVQESNIKDLNYYKNTQDKIKHSLSHTFKKLMETDKYNKAILKDYNSFFSILAAIAYRNIKRNKEYLDLTKFL